MERNQRFLAEKIVFHRNMRGSGRTAVCSYLGPIFIRKATFALSGGKVYFKIEYFYIKSPVYMPSLAENVYICIVHFRPFHFSFSSFEFLPLQFFFFIKQSLKLFLEVYFLWFLPIFILCFAINYLFI